MGMFDYIRCEMPLPSEPAPPAIEWFQTKDVPTDQLYLEKWKITASGELVKLGVRYEDRGDKTAPLGSAARVVGCMTPVHMPDDDKAFPFHGDLNFGHYDSKTGEDWEYMARFTEGKCTKIWCAEHTDARHPEVKSP